MVMPSLIGTGLQINATTAGDQTGTRVLQLTNGTALVYWSVAGSTAPVVGRIVGTTGTPVGGDIAFPNIAAGATVSVAEMPNGGFVIVSRTGTAIRVETFDAAGASTKVQNLTSSEAITGGPLVETTSDGTIGIYVKTTSQAQVGALDANLNLVLPFGTLILNNGTAQSAYDADGSIFTLIDGAGVGTGGFGFASTRGTGAATVIQLHIVSLATQTDVSGPITIASGAGVDVASFRLNEMANGNLLASWIDGTSVRAQIYAPSGAAVGAAIVAAATAPTGATATGLADGGVLLAWSDVVAGTRDIRAQVFTSTGAAASDAFTVNDAIAGAQTMPGAALLGSGDIVVAFDTADGTAIDIGGRVLSFTRPDAVNDSFTVEAGSTTVLPVLANDADPRGQALTITQAGALTGGGALNGFGADGVTLRAPATAGTVNFSYFIANSSGGTDTASVTVTVRAAVTIAPLVRIDPATGATGASVVADVAVTFNAAVTRGSGTIVLARTDGTVVESFDIATSTRVTLTGGRVVIDPTRALDPGAGYTLSVPAGALIVGGASYAGVSGYGFTTTSAAADATSRYGLILPTGAAATASGSGDVFGDAGAQRVTIADLPGRVVLDPSFNRGGDTVVLAGAAAIWTAQRNGSSLILSDGDTVVQLPVGLVGADVQFGDGVRTVKFTSGATAITLGDQTVGTTAAPVSATAGPATATGAIDATLASQLVVAAGQTATAAGNLQVFGTAGAETVRATGATLVFDGSFNTGGDAIQLNGRAEDYSAIRNGSTLVLTGAGQSVTVPVGIVGAQVVFADGARTVQFERLAGGGVGNILLGTQAVTTTAAAVTATATTAATLDQDGDGNLATPFAISAAGGNFVFADNGDVAQNVRITDFARGDRLVLGGPASTYAFSSQGSDLVISHVGSDGRLSTTVLVGLGTAGDGIFVNGEASAERAAGFDFVSFTV